MSVYYFFSFFPFFNGHFLAPQLPESFRGTFYFGSQNVLLKGRITFSKNILKMIGDNLLKMFGDNLLKMFLITVLEHYALLFLKRFQRNVLFWFTECSSER